MIIRQMTEMDIDRVYDVTCSSLDETFVPAVFNLFISQWSQGQLVAVDNTGRIMGYISGTLLSNEKATITLFAVDHKYRRTGIGTKLLESFIKKAVICGRRQIHLDVRPGSDAITLYEKMGFKKTGYMTGFYNDGGDAVHMVRFSMMNS